MSWLKDRHAIVTGAAGGLGSALCLHLLDAGCRVSAIDIDEQGLSALPATIARECCDLTDEDAVRAAVDSLRQQNGAIDLAIANAGVTHLKNFTTGESAAVRRVMAINFFGAVHLIDATVEDLRAKSGLAVGISSVAGYAPLVGRTAYAASKHAMHGFFDTLRLELRDDGVDVLVVCPSYIATGIRKRYATETSDRQAGRVVGAEDSPDAAAAAVVSAIVQRRRFLAVGRVGRLARLIHRFSPRLYESMMLRRIRQEKA